MSKFNTGSFIANGSAVNVDVGFIPDLIIALEGQEETNPQMHIWSKDRADAASGQGEFGFVRSGTGTLTEHAAAVNGFDEYDTSVAKLAFDNPAGDGVDLIASMPSAFVAGTAQPTARTTSTLGTMTKPSSGNETGFVYECTTSAGVYGTEPTTWATKPGDTTSDGTNTWTCRETKVVQSGVKGFTLGATGQTDSDEWTWFAWQADKVSSEVDAAAVDFV